MSLHKFFNIPSPPLKKTKTDEERKDQQKEYDQERRKRSFQPSWSSTYSWLENAEDGSGMRCQVCTKYDKTGSFVTGCTNFRLETIRKHANSEGQIMNTKKVKALNTPSGSCSSDMTKPF